MESVEVKHRVIAIARDLHTLAASSYGPAGRIKVLQPNEESPDTVEVTSIAERIINRLGTSECPIASVYLHVLKSRVRNHTDGGLLTMLLSSKLQLIAQDGVLSHVPHHVVVQGYQFALAWCLAYLDDSACPVRISVDRTQMAALFAILRGILGSKFIAITTTSAGDPLIELIPLLVETFVSVLPFVLEHPGESLPIRFVHDGAYASSLHNSRVLKNSVLLDVHHHTADAAKLLPLENVRVLLFSVSLDPSRPEGDNDEHTNGIVVTCDPSDEAEAVAFQRLADTIAATGVRVVLSQKLVPLFLQRYLAVQGILAIERLGITHMRAVQLLTGATALGDWRAISVNRFATNSTGFLTSVRMESVNHTEKLLLENSCTRSGSENSWPVTTLVLSARNEYAYTELVHVTMSCFKRLEAILEAPDAIAGAGCAEIHLAAWLRRHAGHLVVDYEAYDGGCVPATDRAALRQLRTVINAFADALESVVVAFDHGVHGLADEVIEKMREANSATLDELPEASRFSLFGWDQVTGNPQCVATVAQQGQEDTSEEETTSDEDNASEDGSESRVLVSAFVLDALDVKRDALATAVECATMLLRVATVVHTSP